MGYFFGTNIYVFITLLCIQYSIIVYICSDQTWNLHNHGIFSTNYIIIVKKYFKRPNIYLESARRDLQNSVKILVKFFSKQKIL